MTWLLQNGFLSSSVFNMAKHIHVCRTQRFIGEYVVSKQKEFKCPDSFTTSTVQEAVPSRNGEAHGFLSLEATVTAVFNKLANPDKRSMAEVCKCWAKWFLVGTETSKVHFDYNRQLVTENYKGIVTLSRNGRMVQRFCLCVYYRSDKDKHAYHLRLARQQSAEDNCMVYDSEACGSEGYYDSDC